MSKPLDPLTIPLHGSRMIEASAGTGKTYTIAALYLRLILGHGDGTGHGRPLAPPEILVVTFTNAATQELRDRIRSRLAQAAAFFRNEDSGDDTLLGLRNAFSPEIRMQKAWTLDQAAQWMDEAAIFTIHGWAQRMLHQHAFDSDTLFELALEPNDRELLEEAARDYWRTFLYPLAYESLTELLGLIRCDTPQDLLVRLRPFFGLKTEPSLNPFALLHQRCEAIEAARQPWASGLDEAIQRLRKAKEDQCLSGNKYRSQTFERWLDQTIHWVQNQGPLPEEKARYRFSATGIAEGLNKNKTAPEHPAYEAFDRLNHELASLEIEPAFYFHAAGEIARRYEKEKQRRGQMGYDDLLKRLAQALSGPAGASLADIIRRQFPVALIDEFQDTDPLQYRAFEKIYAGRDHTGLVLIGDPKQAIYAFRGADIHTYLQARAKTGRRRYTLEKNYRSTTGMVESVNQVFQWADGHDQGAFLFGTRIPFEPVSAAGLDENLMIDGEPVDGLRFWLLPQDEPVNKGGADGYLSRMAEGFAVEMVRLFTLAGKKPSQAFFATSDGGIKPLGPSDVAVLVRNRQEADSIRKALANRNLGSVFLSDKESVYATIEAEEVYLLLRACAMPGRDDHLRSALAVSLLCLPMGELDRFNEDEAHWEQQVQRFGRYRHLWEHRGVLPMLQTLFRDYDVPEKLLSREGGERALTNLLHLSELLHTASIGLAGPRVLIQWFTERIQNPEEGKEEEILRLESDADVVRVITIHKSKGLEFPLVFIPFICCYHTKRKGETPVAIYHDDQGRKVVKIPPDDQDMLEMEKEQLAEDLRLLYVAVTRARFACWLGIGVMGKTLKTRGEKSELHRSGIGYVIGGGEEIPTAQLRETLETLRGRCGHIVIDALPAAGNIVYTPHQETTTRGTARKFTGYIFSDWSITSYSGIVAHAGNPDAVLPKHSGEKTVPHAADSPVEDQLHEATTEAVDPVSADPKKRTIHTFPRGPQPGVLLHDLMEWAAAGGFDIIAGDRDQIKHQVLSLCRHHEWEAWADILTDWCQHLLRTPVTLPDRETSVRLDQLAAGSYQAELEFLFSAHDIDTATIDDAVTRTILPGRNRPRLRSSILNGMLKGFIDLAFLHEGRYYVLDYKSNHLGDDESAYDSETLSTAICEHRYDLQYVLYTLAMHRHLRARLPGYRYEKHVGGGIYLFLRGINGKGNGVFSGRPPRALIETLDSAFAGRESNRAI